MGLKIVALEVLVGLGCKVRESEAIVREAYTCPASGVEVDIARG